MFHVQVRYNTCSPKMDVPSILSNLDTVKKKCLLAAKCIRFLHTHTELKLKPITNHHLANYLLYHWITLLDVTNAWE